MTPLPTGTPAADCWNVIGVRGDRSCPELTKIVHCHHCPVFAAAGRTFLDAPTPPGYLDEWTGRLAAPVEQTAADQESVLVFRMADEWLAMPIASLVEVTTLRPVHRVPHRGGLLDGIVNIRGELNLCVHLAKLLGTDRSDAPARSEAGPPQDRLMVIRRGTDTWVFHVDAVEKVVRVPRDQIGLPPATVGRAAAHLARGVFDWERRTVGLLDDARLFEALRARVR